MISFLRFLLVLSLIALVLFLQIAPCSGVRVKASSPASSQLDHGDADHDASPVVVTKSRSTVADNEDDSNHHKKNGNTSAEDHPDVAATSVLSVPPSKEPTTSPSLRGLSTKETTPTVSPATPPTSSSS